MNDEIEAAGDGADEPQLALHRIYLKDASFETPAGPQAFDGETAPEINMQLGTNVQPLAADAYEVVLSITVTATAGDKTVFLVEVQQAGLFGIRGFGETDLGPLLGSYCPNMLYAFAREAVADLVAKGGFPQLLLAPVNFDALYAQHLQQQAQGESAPPPTAH